MTVACAKRGMLSVIEAFELAERIDAKAAHVLPGIAKGTDAFGMFKDNLEMACDLSGEFSGCLLGSIDKALEIISKIGRTQLKLLFDFYHAGRMRPDPLCIVS